MAVINVEAEKRAYLKLIAEGLTPHGACAMIGNMEAESDGFYANRVEYLCRKRMRDAGICDWGDDEFDKLYTEKVDSGKFSCEQFLHPLPGRQYGFGFCQWTSPGRKSRMYNMAKGMGVSIADEDMQIEFLLYELRTSYVDVFTVLKSATDIRTASDVVLKRFEIPADTGEAVCISRAVRGQRFYENYAAEEEKTMEVRMSNCGHDENGRYSGGKAGDQTGTEWYLRPWYAYPWNYVIRWKDAALGNLFADLAIEAAQNNLVGYDQYQRDTFWQHLKASGYRPKNITVACEADCSSGTIALIRAVGYLKGIPELQKCDATYTGNMMNYFQSANGKKYFDVLVGKHLTSSSVAKRGDINLNVQHHVNITIDNGVYSGTNTADKGYLEKGDKGADVKTMQSTLIACGYSCGGYGADGEFGSATDEALRKFQKENGLVVDGQYGQKSKAKLEAVYSSKNPGKKTVTELAKEVIAGKWGTGADREARLIKAGHDYDVVQKEVNRLMKKAPEKSVKEVAQEVIRGLWGNGEDRVKRLEDAGYDAGEVQDKVNELL